MTEKEVASKASELQKNGVDQRRRELFSPRTTPSFDSRESTAGVMAGVLNPTYLLVF